MKENLWWGKGVTGRVNSTEKAPWQEGMSKEQKEINWLVGDKQDSVWRELGEGDGTAVCRT